MKNDTNRVQSLAEILHNVAEEQLAINQMDHILAKYGEPPVTPAEVAAARELEERFFEEEQGA